jgi:hypothetical protein
LEKKKTEGVLKMISVVNNGEFIEVYEDNYQFSRWEVVKRFLENVDYKMQLDYSVEIEAGSLIGFKGGFYPNNGGVNILNGLKELEEGLINQKEWDIDLDDLKISFRLLLIR